MDTTSMIPLQQICVHHKIEKTFLIQLQHAGLIEVIQTEETICIPEQQLPHLEKIIRLYEMDINIEGIEAIAHLLNQIETLQQKVTHLNNQLMRYE